MTIVHRTLAPEEVQRALDAGGPLQELQLDATRLAEMSVAVVEVDGVIVAYWVVWYALHVEPLWIAEAWRKHPRVVSGIVEEMQAIVEATQEPVAYCEIQDENLEVVSGYAARLGFHEAPGKLFYVIMQPVPEPVGV
jgi:hypothetical protein